MNAAGAILRVNQPARVVGTIITADFFRQWRQQPHRFPCELVELRVDGFPGAPEWVAAGEEIEEYDIPVFATVRLEREGGHWKGPDSDRWPLLEEALRRLSGVDVELGSDLTELAARLARELNRFCVLSYHNFQSTPPLDELRTKLQRAHELGAIGKLAVTVNTPEDLDSLKSLLAEKWPLPVCLIGMGALGRATRLEFPKAGSCFTYGYLDQPGAPGQYSAAELMTHLGRTLPEPKLGSGV